MAIFVRIGTFLLVANSWSLLTTNALVFRNPLNDAKAHTNISKPLRKRASSVLPENISQPTTSKSSPSTALSSRPPWSAPLLSTLAATTVFLSPFSVDLQSTSPFFTIQESHNRAWALSEAQILVDDVWKEVTRQYVDQSFNGLGEEGWRKKRLEAVTKAGNTLLVPDDDGTSSSYGDNAKVYEIISNLLSNLGDPYTRFLAPNQYEAITSYARGSASSQQRSGGIGVQLSTDPRSGDVVVMNTIADGPAATSGVQPGDSILSVDGTLVEGATAEFVASKCRGEPGTTVQVLVRHDETGDGKFQDRTIDITRSVVQTNKVKTSIVEVGGEKIGLIILPSFNQVTETEIREALTSLKATKAIAIDLRGNVGGYMPAGVEVAKMFLQPRQRIISEVDKTGRATIFINDGVGSDVSKPLYLLVDSRTASASEILTAALQDNERATVLGTKTFGKGRIQNVQELQYGTGVAVTKAKYITPKGNDIQGIGISPDFESEEFCGSKASPVACLTAWKSKS